MPWASKRLIAVVALATLFPPNSTRSVAAPPTDAQPLAGTEPLTWDGDIASRLVDGVDRFLLKQIDASPARRDEYWRANRSTDESPEGDSAEAHTRRVEESRERLAHFLGARDPRHDVTRLELLATTSESSIVAEHPRFVVHAVRWPVVGDMHGEGLLLTPRQESPVADVVAIPDADQTPEQLIGLAEGVAPEGRFASRLAASGCRVLIPVLVDRTLKPRNGRATMTNREFVYRGAFELGRHVIGYEIQKVLAGIDWFEHTGDGRGIGVYGWGEGGMLALYCGALDSRISTVAVSGYFESREQLWREPLSRNVFGLLERFGDAELAAMVHPRRLIVEACRGPEIELPSQGGGPGRLVTPRLEDVRAEVARAERLVREAAGDDDWRVRLVEVQGGAGPPGREAALREFSQGFTPAWEIRATSEDGNGDLTRGDNRVAIEQRQARQIHEMDRHTQWLLRESPYVRRDFMKRLDTSSLTAYAKSIEPYRDYFRDEVIGHFDVPRLPARPRTRKAYDRPGWVGHEVVLDVFPDVIAYGILLIPKDLKEGEKRPVVVCQHGLEGRPQDVVAGDHRAYHDFAAKLAERGFITFAPQNLYIFQDRFRTLQRKANPLKKTLFSIMVPQHQQIVDWLATLPQVDPERIAFYGLSYGGKSAMRIPPLVDRYCLSICSADFNDWVWKNASTRSDYSYVWTGEYEIFEFDLGGTFNYSEMAALIAPRPFMVERGHFDGVAPDERVGHEFAKVRHLYAARLKLPDRCEIEWFDGPHTIRGQGTFRFLEKHLLDGDARGTNDK